jgi:hypothetical protein
MGDIAGLYQKSSRGELHSRMAGLWYDTPPVEAVTIPVDIPDKTPCALPHDFIRKNFRINPFEGGLCGTFSIYRYFSRKKGRLNRCSASVERRRSA